MKTKNIYKEAGVLLVATLMVLSAVVVTADTETLEVESPKVTSTFKDINEKSPLGPVVWDNGMEYDGLGASQWDEPGNFDAHCADDFHFDEDTIVWDVHWIGGYWNGDPAEFSWCIAFFIDDGSGAQPVGIPYQPSHAGPFCFEWEEIDKEDLGDGYYKMSVILPDGILFIGCEKYWIAIWGVGAFPPQSGWGYHADPITLHQGVFGSNYFGIPFWTNSEDVFGAPYDFCFQLTAEGDPVPDLECDGSLGWVEVKPGSTVTGDFAVGNIGEAGSMLNWKVKSYPNWGTWTFTPETGVQPVGWITVDVTVVAPSEKNKNFTGEVVVENTDDPSDICRIPVSLSTPYVKSFNFNMNLLDWLFEHFPILKFVLGI